MKLPKHECSLSIEHNKHKDYYETLEESIADEERRCLIYWGKDNDFKKRCIDTDELWTMQWYPRTPISFYLIAAPTLEELLTLALIVEKEGDE